jgi:hypothetical protein
MKDLIVGIILVSPMIALLIFAMITTPALAIITGFALIVLTFFAGAHKIIEYLERRKYNG